MSCTDASLAAPCHTLLPADTCPSCLFLNSQRPPTNTRFLTPCAAPAHPLLPPTFPPSRCSPLLQLVGLHKLETTSLKRYRHTFQLPGVDAAAPKADLLSAVTRHFTTQVGWQRTRLCYDTIGHSSRGRTVHCTVHC